MTATLEISERDLQGAVVSFAQLQGWTIYHTLDSRGSTAGFPDLVLVRAPELVYAELKTDRGKVTSSQQHWLDQLTASGAEVHVWRPADLDEIHERLKRKRSTT